MLPEKHFFQSDAKALLSKAPVPLMAAVLAILIAPLTTEPVYDPQCHLNDSGVPGLDHKRVNTAAHHMPYKHAAGRCPDGRMRVDTPSIELRADNRYTVQIMPPDSDFTLNLETMLGHSKERLAIFLDKTDITALFETGDGVDYRYPADALALPTGRHWITVYQVHDAERWNKIGRWSIAVQAQSIDALAYSTLTD